MAEKVVFAIRVCIRKEKGKGRMIVTRGNKWSAPPAKRVRRRAKV